MEWDSEFQSWGVRVRGCQGFHLDKKVLELSRGADGTAS